MNEINPSAISRYIEKSNQHYAELSKARRSIKIEQNHSWRIRLLPTEMGPEKMPFVAIAQHWWNKQPITCPKHTEEAWGGNPDAFCPVCNLSDRLKESSDDFINETGYKIRVNLKYRTWCIVLDKEDHRGHVEDMSLSEVLNPYEFDMYKTTWEPFNKYQMWAISGRRGGGETSELGLLDLNTGCDLIVTRGAKGLTLNKSDPAPIFAMGNPNFDANLNTIWSRIRCPQIIIPSKVELLAVAAKIEDYLGNNGNGGGGSRGGRGNLGRGQALVRRSRGDADLDDRDTAPRVSSSGGRGGLGGDQDADGDPAPVSRAGGGSGHTQETYPDRRGTTAPEPEPEPESVPPVRRSAPAPAALPARHSAPAPAQQEAPVRRSAPAYLEQAAPPSRRSSLAFPAEPEAEPGVLVSEEDVAQHQSHPYAAMQPPARRAAASASPETGGDEQEENASKGKNDPTQTVRQVVEQMEGSSVVATQAPPPRKVVDNSILQGRLDRLTGKGK